MTEQTSVINQTMIENYLCWLREQERSKATLQKYAHDLKIVCKSLYF